MGLMNFGLKVMSFVGTKLYKKLENMTIDPMKVQSEILFNVINENKDTEYGKLYNFKNIHTIEDFQRLVPINEYDNLAPHIERMTRGEKNLLTSQEVPHFNRTSGTLGCEKRIPVTEKQISIFGKYNSMVCYGVISKELGYKWCKGVGFSLSEGTYEKLPTGVSYGSASSLMAERMNKMGPFKKAMDKMYTSPVEARQPKKGTLTRYIHARFALMEKNVTYGICTFSSNYLEVLRYIEKNWELLVNDIKNGTIDESINLDSDVRNSLLNKIKPMPKRAKELEDIFSQGFDEPFVPKVWPKFTYFFGASGANFTPYTDKLRKFYFGPNIKIVYLGLSASEGYFTTTIGVEKEDCVLVPDGCFMEFVNVNDDPDNPKYLTMDKLVLGESYELIITNYSGIYRYKMYDVIKVTGMMNNTPLVRFEKRAGFAINIFGEKTSEAALRKTIKETEKKFNLDIIDYSVYPDSDKVPSQYVFLLEVDKLTNGVTKQMIRDTIEEELQNANEDIIEEFTEKHLSPTRLVLLQKETYLLYRDVMSMRGVSISQLKPVNVIRNEFQRKFFFGLEDKEL